MNINDLTPEEKAELRAALGDDSGHPDAAQDEMMLQDFANKLADVLDQMMGQIEEQGKLIQNLNTAVFDEMIGGIKNLHETNRRKMGIDDLRGKYGKDLDPYADPFKEMQNGADLYERIFDEIDKLRGAAGDAWNDETEGSEIGKLLEILKNNLKPRGVELEIETPEGGEPEGVKIEKTEIGATGGDMDDLTEMIKKKKKGFKLPNE